MFRDIDGSIDLFAVAIIGFIALVFTIMAVAIIVAVIRGLAQWTRNNNSPLITVPATLIAKRGQTSRDSDNHASTSYYVTFELPGHERLEFGVTGHQWGTLLEGDRGQLTHQGTRYKGFDRVPQDR